MNKRVVSSVEDFLKLSGECLGTSNWLRVDQKMINHFADSTFDHQWIHVDPFKAKTESTCHTTIVHGYFTLSLIPHFLEDIIELKNLKQLVNYSIDKMVFHSFVPVDSRLRMKATLKSAKDLGNICKATILCSFEVDGSDTPVLEGSIVFLYYF